MDALSGMIAKRPIALGEPISLQNGHCKAIPSVAAANLAPGMPRHRASVSASTGCRPDIAE